MSNHDHQGVFCASNSNSEKPQDGSDGPEISAMEPGTSGALIRQMAAVFLSDSSESDQDINSPEDGEINLCKEEVLEKMYTKMEELLIDKKKKECKDNFTNSWLQSQETLCSQWKKRGDLKNDMSDLENEKLKFIEGSKRPTSTVKEIPRVTKLKFKPSLSKEYIEKQIATMDVRKRERWEKWFIEAEQAGSPKQRVFKSNLRKDMDRLKSEYGKENLSQLSRNKLASFKDRINASVMQLERVMGNLEAGEETKHQHREEELLKAPGKCLDDQNSTADETVQDNERDEISSTSDDGFLDEKEIEEYEELLHKNVLLCPNLQQIQDLLRVNIELPEPEIDPIQLGYSMQELEKELLKSKNLESYIVRVVYFFTYKPQHNAEYVKAAYEGIVNINGETGAPQSTCKGCLLIYENVNMAIVMVEGREFEVLQHFHRLKGINLFKTINRGKVLYIHNSILKLYFNKWVVRIENPPPGKVAYATRSKKVLHRVAAARVSRCSVKLHKLYRHISKEERYFVDPKNLYIKSKYLVLLPSPAMFAYLLKYNILRDITKYVEQLGKHQYIGSDDEELFAFTEDILYGNYIDSDDDRDVKEQKLRYAKEVTKGVEEMKKVTIKDLYNLKDKETNKIISWDNFPIDEISPTIIDSRVRLSEEWNHPAVRAALAIEARQSQDAKEKRKQKNEKSKDSKSGLLNFLERGSERWLEKMNWYGATDLGYNFKTNEGGVRKNSCTENIDDLKEQQPEDSAEEFPNSEDQSTETDSGEMVSDEEGSVELDVNSDKN